jgi:hypothetical protein
MLNGFEEETAKLTEYELSLAKIMAGAFQSRVGIENAITAGQIVASMSRKGHKITEPRVRKIVHFLVATKQVNRLVATSKGYHIAKSDQEVEDHVLSLIQRAASIVIRAQAYPCFPKVAMGVKQLKVFEQ